MKSLSDLLHRSPWWALVLVGVAAILALGVLVTPFHLIEYRKEGATPEESQAIKREIDNTFAEGAMDIAKRTILAMRASTQDPERRAELDRALQELESARAELRDAGSEMQRDLDQAQKEAAKAAGEAVSEAKSAIEEARRSAEAAVREAGLDSGKTRIVIGTGAGKDRPLIDIEVSRGEPPVPPGAADAPPVPEPPSASMPRPPAVIVAPLPPEVRAQIRENITQDLKKMGVGAALVLLFIPLFVVTLVAKFFIDRSRAAQRLAELTRKEAEYHRMSQQVTEAKLQALQAQVEPHFLYNTLANVQALTEVDPARAHTMVGHLIQYLRNALPKMRESISTVGQELELVRSYLSILQMRMGRRLAFEISVPENLLATPFPPLMLPSLVENAIKHGLEPQRDGGAVIITAQASDGRLRLVVSDTGRGFGEVLGSGVGLENIRERLAALYGDAAKLTLEANSPHGVIATIEAPLDGLRAVPAGAPGAPAQPAEPKTAAGKVISAVGTAERAWRKTLTFTFNALVIVAAVVAGLAIFGVSTGFIPMSVEPFGGQASAGMGVVGISVAFAAVVLTLAILVAVLYGLGWLFAALAIFIPVVILIATLPATAPFILLGLAIWWLYRRRKGPFEPEPQPKVEPTLQPEPPAPPVPPVPPVPPSPPPIPGERPPAG